jgi:hypothetical protein
MSTEAGPIRILSVDDHPVLRQEIAALVAGQSDMRLVAEASDGREAIPTIPYASSRRHLGLETFANCKTSSSDLSSYPKQRLFS